MILTVLLCYLAVGFICAVLWFSEHQPSGRVADVLVDMACCLLLWPMVLFTNRQ